MISTLSMVKLLNYITPAVIVPDLMAAINGVFTRKDGTCQLAFFFASRVICLLVGFDAFLYKFQILAFQFERCNKKDLQDRCAGPEVYDTVVFAALFVNQMLGIVQLGWFTKQRIFLFIFAGEDGQMSSKERAIKMTWEAMVCYKSQEIHGWIKGMFFWLCFSDSDFQKMVLDDKDDDSGDVAHVKRKTLEEQENKFAIS